MGIEPTSLAWEARVMPLYDARVACWFPVLLPKGRRLHFTALNDRMTNLSLKSCLIHEFSRHESDRERTRA